jgi:hypothetical protein
MQVQECIPHSVSPALGQQLVSLQALFHPSVWLHVAPLTGGAKGMRWVCLRLAFAEMPHGRRPVGFVRCARMAIERSKVAGDGIGAHAGIARLGAEVSTARERRLRA